MKTFLLSLLTLVLAACGSAGEAGGSCHTESTKAGANIWCDDGSEAFVSNGDDGADGKDGQDGADGTDGRDGRDGDNGSDGQDGADGDPATATRVIESYFCATGLEGTGVRYTYNAVLWSSGDLLVTGTVSSLAISAGKTALYTSSQKGYATAIISVEFDTDNTVDGGWYDLSLDRSTLVNVIVYHPTSRAVPEGTVLKTWTLPPTACVHNKY